MLVMSRIKTDLKPTVKSVPSLTSTSSKQSESSSIFPPVAVRTASTSPRNVDLKRTVDMVRGITMSSSMRDVERPRASGNISPTKSSETHRTSRDSEKLHHKCQSLQEIIRQLRDEINVKNKTIAKLQEKLSGLEAGYEQVLKKHEEIIAQSEYKIEKAYEEVKELKGVSIKRIKEMDEMKKEVEETKNECDQKVESVIKKTDAQIDAICQTHKEELRNRDSKLAALKLQLELALKNNSRERQRQLEELTKELRRVTDETEMLKAKLRSLANQTQLGKCRNCTVLEETLKSKLKELRMKDSSIAELLQNGQKMATQLSRQDEFLKLCERSNVKHQ